MVTEVRLQPVTENLRELLLQLQLDPEQKDWLGPIDSLLSRDHDPEDGVRRYPFAVYQAADLVGFALYTGVTESVDRHYVGGLLIDRRFQRRGLGRAAMRALLHFICENTDCQIISLTCHPDNIPAISLYKSLGFRDEGWTFDGETVFSAQIREI